MSSGVVGVVGSRVERTEGWAPSVSIDPRMSRREGEKKKVDANLEGSFAGFELRPLNQPCFSFNMYRWLECLESV